MEDNKDISLDKMLNSLNLNLEKQMINKNKMILNEISEKMENNQDIISNILYKYRKKIR